MDRPIADALDMALANTGRSGLWQTPRGGVIRSGDLEIVIDRLLRISRREQTVHRLEIKTITGLAFRSEDGTLALVATSRRRPPRRLLDAADLSAAEWALFAELITEVTYHRLTLDEPFLRIDVP